MQSPGNLPDREPDDLPDRAPAAGRSRRRNLWRWVGRTAILGSIALVAGGTGFGWYWLHYRFSDFLSATLSDTLMRPVKVGPLTGVSLGGLTFGESALLPTAQDPDGAKAGSVAATFDIWSIARWPNLVGDRVVPIAITFNEPSVYIEQANDSTLFELRMKSGPKPPFEIRPTRFEFKNAQVTLVPAPALVNRPKRSTPVLPVKMLASGSLDLERWREGQPELARFDLVGQVGQARPGQFDLKGEFLIPTQELAVRSRLQNFDVTGLAQAMPAPMTIERGRVDGVADGRYRLGVGIPDLQGTLQLKDWRITSPLVPQPITLADGRVRLRGPVVTLDDAKGRYGLLEAIANGPADFTGTVLNLQNPLKTTLEVNYDLTLRAEELRPADIAATCAQTLPVSIVGPVEVNARLKGTLDRPEITGSFASVSGLRVDRLAFNRVQGDFSAISAGTEPPKTSSLRAFENWQARLVRAFPLAARLDRLRIEPAAGGSIAASGSAQLLARGALDKLGIDRLAADWSVQGVPIGSIARAYGVTLPTDPGAVSVTGRSTGNLARLDTTLETTLLGGRVAAAAQLRDRAWSGSATVSGLQVGRLVPQLSGALSARAVAQGTLDRPLQALNLNAEGNLANLAGGRVDWAAQATGDRWQLQTQLAGIQLARLVPQGTGQLSSRVTAQGTVAGLLARDPASIAASVTGQLRPGDRSSLLTAAQANYLNQQLPIDFAARWDGQVVRLDRAVGPGLHASGTIIPTIPPQLASPPSIRTVNLQVALRNINLEPLPGLMPGLIPPAVRDAFRDRPLLLGRANFTGSVVGPLDDLRAIGSTNLVGLDAAGANFDLLMTGPVDASLRRGIVIDLKGEHDRLAVRLDRQFMPQSFDLRWQGATATGRRQGRDLIAELANFRLDRIRWPQTIVQQAGAPLGTVAAKLRVNLDRLTANGSLTVDRPGLGVVVGDRFTALLGYANNRAVLTDGKLTQGDSEYLATAEFVNAADPRFSGQVQARKGQLATLVRALQLTDFESAAQWAKTLRPPTYARASEVQPLPVEVAALPVEQQLRKLSEIKALINQSVNQRCRLTPIANLDRIQGRFGADLTFNGTVRTGIQANFSLTGQDWSWLPEEACSALQVALNADHVEIRGDFKDNILTLAPLEFRRGDTLLSFAGKLGSTQSGQFQLVNFPAEALETIPQIRDLYAQTAIPRLSGRLNLTAALAGTIDDPRAVGQLQLSDGKLNNTPIETATSNFSYAQARLNFSSAIAVQGSQDKDPIAITGSIPQKLPFAKVEPDNNTLRLSAELEDNELGLASLIVPQFRWLGGRGRVQLNAGGTVSQPTITGEAVFDNASISLQGLPDPVTAITGRANFTGDRLVVDGIGGSFGQGQIRIAGLLPISDPKAIGPNESPLNVALDRLRLNLRDLYQGGVNGQISITGTAFKPVIGGDLALVDGSVILPTDPAALTAAAPTNGNAGGGFSPRFQNLKVSLGRGLQIMKMPVLNFLAEGGLELNGTLDDPRPSGTIRLKRGLINLFTTQFTLERGQTQLAEFRPKLGLDPFLDVKMVAFVPDMSRNPLQTDNTSQLGGQNPAEIRESVVAGTGSARSVRVKATVQGPASQLLDHIQLTSRPSRSEAQIFALIGGSLINTFDDRSGGAVALANFAGAGFLNTIQNNIAGAIGLTDLRIYPTTVTAPARDNNRDREDRKTGLGVAIEAGIDLNNSLSISVAQIISQVNNTTRLNLDYRLNDDTLIRGSTDFAGESRLSVQFERRF
jgi:translocation and assembly module TamB